MVICLVCGTEYAEVLRRAGARCDDSSLSDDIEDVGCVGRTVSAADYALIDRQAEVRHLASRTDLGNRPLLRRAF